MAATQCVGSGLQDGEVGTMRGGKSIRRPQMHCPFSFHTNPNNFSPKGLEVRI